MLTLYWISLFWHKNAAAIRDMVFCSKSLGELTLGSREAMNCWQLFSKLVSCCMKALGELSTTGTVNFYTNKYDSEAHHGAIKHHWVLLALLAFTPDAIARAAFLAPAFIQTSTAALWLVCY
jgi:hypothetical protein